jgi:radical SAM superfamily enzyme YgiQ (UPF0313 family)
MNYTARAFSDESEACYGLVIAEKIVQGRGWRRDDINYETILTSCYWPEQLYDLIRWRRKAQVKARIVIGGNTPTCNPAPFLPWVDACYLGDAEEWDCRMESPHIVMSGGGVADIARAKAIYPFIYEDNQRAARSFIEISRGCKNKCAFCQYGWLKPYREANIVDIKTMIEVAKTKSVRVFAADRYQHTCYGLIRTLLVNAGHNDTGSDVSLKFLLKHPEYLKITRKIRIGIEGMSEGLRRRVLKPLTDDEIVETHAMAVAANIKCFDWYMIYGLPWETDSDVDAFHVLLHRLGKVMQGRTLAIHFNAFQPNALTPMQWDAAAVDYPRQRWMRIIGERVPGLCLMYKPGTLTSNRVMAHRMVAVRGSEASKAIAYNIAYNPRFAKDADAIMREFEKAEGKALFDGLGVGSDMAHDRYVRYDRDRLARIRRKCDTLKMDTRGAQ